MTKEEILENVESMLGSIIGSSGKKMLEDKIIKAYKQKIDDYIGNENMNGAMRVFNMMENRINAIRITRNKTPVPDIVINGRSQSRGLDVQAGRDIGKLMAYGRGSSLDAQPTGTLIGGTSLLTKQLREEQRYNNMMSRQKSITIGDDDQFAFGADTGVSKQFEYLREQDNAFEEKKRKIAENRIGHAAAGYERNVLKEYYGEKSAAESASVLLGDNAPSDIPGLTWKQKEDSEEKRKADKLEQQRHKLAISHSFWAKRRDQILATRQYKKDYSRFSMTDDERFIADYAEKQMAMGASETFAKDRARNILAEKHQRAFEDWKKDTGRNGTASEYSRIKDQFGDKASEIWKTVTKDIYEAASDPKEFERKQFARKYGDFALKERDRGESERQTREAKELGAKRLASHQANRRFNWWYDNLSEEDRTMYDTTVHYGGGEEGRRMAEEKIQKDRDVRAAELRKQRRSRDRKMSIAKEQDEKKEREAILEYLPKFDKFQHMELKELRQASKFYKKMEKLPFGIGSALKSPIGGAMLAMSALGAAEKVFNVSDSANSDIVGWKNAANMYGAPSQEFTKAAMLAGVKDPAKIAELYGKLTLKYGDADTAVKQLGSSMGGMDAKTKLFYANSLGLDPTMTAIFDIMSGNGNVKMDRSRRVNANRNMIDIAQKYGLSSDSSVFETFGAWSMYIPGVKGAMARDMEDGWNGDSAKEDFYRIMQNQGLATDAAESLKNAEAVGNGGGTSNTTNNNQQTSCTIQNITLDAGKSETLVAALGNALSGQGGLSVLDWANNYNGSRVA